MPVRVVWASLLLLLATPKCILPADSTVRPPLTVMSYNIRYDTALDTLQRAWSARRSKVADIVQSQSADVVGTQEGKLHQLMDLENALPGYDWVGVGRKSGGDEFSAIFYRTGRLTLLEHDTFWLSESPNEPGSKSWGAALPRIATWARFRAEGSGDSLLVLNTHLDHASQEARVKSARLITDTLDALARGVPVVVMGDVNARPDSESYRTFTRRGANAGSVPLRDALQASQTPHRGPGSTFNDFEPEVLPDERLDYIFVGPRLQVHSHTHLDEKRDGHYPSDHLPVVAELELP